MTSVKILPYRPPARLIRTKYKLYYLISGCVREVKKKAKFPILALKVVAYERLSLVVVVLYSSIVEYTFVLSVERRQAEQEIRSG